MEKEMITTKFQGLKTKRICGKYFSHLKLILSWQRWQLWSNMIYTPTHTQVYLKAHESMAPVSTGSENSIQVIKKDLAKSLFQKALKVKVLVAQACLAVWDSINCSLPGSSVHGILQAKILKWVAIPFSREFSWPRERTGTPASQADSLPPELQGSPKMSGKGETNVRNIVTLYTIFSTFLKYKTALNLKVYFWKIKNRALNEMIISTLLDTEIVLTFVPL